MVYDNNTLELLHDPTPEGEELYRKMLEDKGTEILFRDQHPLLWFWGQLMDWLRMADED